jgi:hypothetical protein
MTLDKARQLIASHLSFGSGYNRNATRLILAEVERVHGREAVDALIRELDLEDKFGLSTGTSFSGAVPVGPAASRREG